MYDYRVLAATAVSVFDLKLTAVFSCVHHTQEAVVSRNPLSALFLSDGKFFFSFLVIFLIDSRMKRQSVCFFIWKRK